jgi:cell division protein FtsI/penicillin-binding protein 2
MSYRQSPLSTRGRNSGRPRAAVPVIVVVFAVVVAVGLFLWHPWSSASTDGNASPKAGGSAAAGSKPDATARAFAAAWSKHDFSGATYAGGLTAATVATDFDAITKKLNAQGVTVTAGPAQPVQGNDNADQSVLHVSWVLPGGQAWTYDSAVELDQIDGRWAAKWAASVVHPSLGPGDTLRYVRSQPKRATILDGAGQPLIVDRAVVDIGVQPGKTTDAVATATQLGAILHVDGASLASRIKGAPADQFVDVITLRANDFAPVAAAVSAVPGVVLHQLNEPLSPSHDFARALLGTVGPVTKEIVDASHGRYVAGDVGGLSGLEKEYDTELGGVPGYEVDAVHSSAGGSTPLPTPLASKPAVDGQPVRTTLDQRVQAAADAALATVPGQPSALVAIKVSSGQVVAVANGPNGGGFDTALLGQVPPGSAFKIVTTTALLEGGQDVDAPVPCQANVVVQGKTFHNYENEQLGSPPFHTDFAKSCNTAFIALSSKVGGSTLPDTARALGIGACWSLGTQAFRGSVQQPKDAVDLAATSFGQGSTLVSPVDLAVAVATVARGSYLPPQLVLNGRSAGCSSGGSSSASPSNPASSSSSASPSDADATPVPGPPLPTSVIGHLHSLMREVVTAGTATVLAAAPGGPVMAKTGTAEYGSTNPPKTHAWLVGYQGDIAFAVYVQDGQSGGTVAAPVALKFLQNLAAH